MKKLDKIDKIIVHCSASEHGDAETIRKWHLERGWDDIGYHYVILPDGTVEKGRGVEWMGAHCRGQNANSISIVLIGNEKFTSKQLVESLPLLLKELMFEYNLTSSSIYGHYEFTDLKTCPNINMMKYRRML